MTLIASLEAQDGLVIASDSRGTIGDPRSLTAVDDTHKKIFRLSECCGIATSGAAELSNRLIDKFQTVLATKKLVDIDPIVDEFINWAKQEYQKWFGPKPFVFSGQGISDQRPPMNFIAVGYNRSNKQSRIYLLTTALEFAPQLCTSGHMLAGVPQYAIYLIHRLYNPQMRLANIKSLAAYLIQETATQDPKVGGPIKMAQITLDGGYQELPVGEIDEIVRKNEEQNARLRQFFFQGEA